MSSSCTPPASSSSAELDSNSVSSSSATARRSASRSLSSTTPDLRLVPTSVTRSPPCSPRRGPRVKGAYKRASVASVLSGFSLPEETSEDEGGQAPEPEVELIRSTVVFPRFAGSSGGDVGGWHSAPTTRSASPEKMQTDASRPASAISDDTNSTAAAVSRPASTVSLPVHSSTPSSPLVVRRRSTLRSSTALPTRSRAAAGLGERTLSSPAVPSLFLRQGVATATGPPAKRPSSLTYDGEGKKTSGLGGADNTEGSQPGMKGHPASSSSSVAGPERPTPVPPPAPIDPAAESDDAASRRRRLKQAEKNRRVVRELIESERSYVAGLEVVVDHFMRPLLKAADGPSPPLLGKKAVGELFGPVLDIAAFSRALLEALEPLASSEPAIAEAGDEAPVDAASQTTSAVEPPPPPSSKVALALGRLMPFLSLYHPFIANFPHASARLATLRKDPASSSFAAWLAEREGMEEARRLRLGDWLLTVVQRVPRYLLLVKDLVSCTPEDDSEYAELQRVLTLVESVTEALNGRLHDIAATQELVSLHRAFAGSLPQTFSLVVPGRRLLKQGVLSKVGSRKAEDRTFWLFNDLFIYGTTASPAATAPATSTKTSGATRPPLNATRSVISWIGLSPAEGGSSSVGGLMGGVLDLPLGARRSRFVFHRAIRLEELTVVGSAGGRPGEERHAFEILSPDKSFVIVAETRELKHAWLLAIREAKTRLLADLRTLNTTEEHTMRRHRRRSLQAMPFASTLTAVDPAWSTLRPLVPGTTTVARPASLDASSTAVRAQATVDAPNPSDTVETFTAAVWVPDAQAERCMRCREAFSVWRWRHHCRMCGVVCCHACSSKAVQINDSADAASATHGARTCDACYAALFPPSTASGQSGVTLSRPNSDHSSSTASDERLPTPGDSLERLTEGLQDSEQGRGDDSGLPSSVKMSGTSTISLLPRNQRAFAVRSPALGTLKTSASRSAALFPFPTSADSVDDATLRPSRRPAVSLGTLKASRSPFADSSSPAAAANEFGRQSSHSPDAWPVAPRRTRLLSATNDRFSAFVGGGVGGEEWAGRAEMATLAGERVRRESGERWGDASLRSGEASELLRRMLGSRTG